ncbi:MAG: carboxypeptidase-like regulatory domain-containing protein, partial [Thermoplasmata archaeon]|nr:carboxypeptidase-like regulatory domain-containing protein [Thermoplasmata archaeon]
MLDQATLAALGGATVKLIRAGAAQAEVTTSASGYYAFANLVAGTYTLSVNASGYRNASHDLILSDSGVVLDF